MTNVTPGTDPYGAPGAAEATGATAYGGSAGSGGTSAGSPDHAPGEVSSIGTIIANISSDLSTLMRQEVELAKVEVKDSATKAGKGAGLLGGAGVAANMALLFLSIALWWGLGSLLDNHGWAAVVVAVIWGIIAAVLASMGRKNLKTINGMPRTVETAKQVPDALKGNEETA
jgi:hypothetical protein